PTPALTPTLTLPRATITTLPSAVATVQTNNAVTVATPAGGMAASPVGSVAATPAVSTAATSTTLGAPVAEELDPPELRAVWVDAFHDGFKTPQQVDELVAWARGANLNALFVQVRRRGDAYYLKSLEPRTEDPDLTPGFDALQYLIDKSHQGPRRLQVHAWLATLPIWWQRDTPPLAPNHAFNLRGPSAGPAD